MALRLSIIISEDVVRNCGIVWQVCAR